MSDSNLNSTKSVNLSNRLKKSIRDLGIEEFVFDKFKIIDELGKGASGIVYRATDKYKNIVAMKSLRINNEDILKSFINELELHRKVCFHNNILQFHGVCKKDDVDYFLIVEYADSGTLRKYLQEKSLGWNVKLKFAQQIASALMCLHDRDIIHRDLQPNNILVHQGLTKLADFGLSRELSELSKSTSDKMYGLIPYTDPQRFQSKRRRKKESDIYSFGVLLWEISSRCPPFEGDERPETELMSDLINEVRERKIKGTPDEYVNLYSKCWNGDPNKRPDIYQVFESLNNMDISVITSDPEVYSRDLVNDIQTLSESMTSHNEDLIVNDDFCNKISISKDKDSRSVNETNSIADSFNTSVDINDYMTNENDCVADTNFYDFLKTKNSDDSRNNVIDNPDIVNGALSAPGIPRSGPGDINDEMGSTASDDNPSILPSIKVSDVSGNSILDNKGKSTLGDTVDVSRNSILDNKISSSLGDTVSKENLDAPRDSSGYVIINELGHRTFHFIDEEQEYQFQIEVKTSAILHLESRNCKDILNLTDVSIDGHFLMFNMTHLVTCEHLRGMLIPMGVQNIFNDLLTLVGSNRSQVASLKDFPVDNVKLIILKGEIFRFNVREGLALKHLEESTFQLFHNEASDQLLLEIQERVVSKIADKIRYIYIEDDAFLYTPFIHFCNNFNPASREIVREMIFEMFVKDRIENLKKNTRKFLTSFFYERKNKFRV